MTTDFTVGAVIWHMDTGKILSSLQILIGGSLAVYNLMYESLLFGLAWAFVMVVGVAFLSLDYQGPAQV